MKGQYKLIILMITFPILSSCNQKIETHNYISSHKMSLSKDKRIYLDDSTVQSPTYLQYFSIKNKNLLAFINEYDISIIINDLETGELYKKIHFEKEGNNGIGTLRAFYLSDDTIYLFNYWNQMLYITNINGEVLKNKIIDLNTYISNINIPTILPRTLSPIYKIDNNLILSGFTSTEKDDENDSNTPTTVIYNIKNDSIHLINSFPPIYHTGFWGGDLNHRGIRYTIGKKKEMVISYSVDEYIYTIDSTIHKKKYYAGGINHTKKIKPISKNRNPNSYNQEDLIEHYMNNITYGGILFDKYREVYYRICLNPNNNSKQDIILRKPASIIILDINFKKIGETFIPKYEYDISSCFISPEGLHIRVESDDDDIMTFKTFKLEQI